MRGYYDSTAEGEAFNEEVSKSIRKNTAIRDYKAINPTYRLLNSADEGGLVRTVGFPTSLYERCKNLGLIDSDLFITQVGEDFLKAPLEL